MVTAIARKRNEQKELLQKITEKRRVQSEIDDTLDWVNIQAGVTATWLGHIFAMHASDVKKRLKDCPPLHRKKSGYIYDLKTAAPYLVTPKFDVEEYVRGMKVSELPSHLSDSFWAALTRKLKYEEAAGDLWRTTKVVEAFGDVFKLIKSTLQLWPNSLEEETALSSDQRKILVRLTDALQDDIYNELLEYAKSSSTPAVTSEVIELKKLNEELAEAVEESEVESEKLNGLF